MIARVIILLICFLQVENKLSPQVVAGSVHDAVTGEPLVGASIYSLQSPERGTSSLVDGTFQLTLDATADSVRITYLGYRAKTVVLSPADTLLFIALTPSIANAAAVTVTAERKPARIFATEQLNRLDVYLNAAAKGDVLLAVNSLPAATNGEETANLSLRGNPYAATGIFFNNVPLFDAVRLDQPNGVGQFSIFNTAMVTELDVYPSNPPLTLGQATAGAVSIRSHEELKDSKTGLSLHLAGAGLQLQRQLGEKSGLLAYANYGDQRVLKQSNPESLAAIDGFQSVDVGLYFTHRWNSNTHLQLFNLSLRERYAYRLRSGRFHGLFDQAKERNLTIVNLVHQQKNWRMEWNQGFNTSRAEYGFGNIHTQLRQVDYHSNLLFHWQQSDWNGTASLSYTTRHERRGGTYPLYTEAWETDDPAGTYQSRLRQELPEAAAFAKRMIGRSTLGLGTRIGYAHQPRLPVWSTQVAWHYPVAQHHVFTVASGRYYQHSWSSATSDASPFNRSYQIAADWEWTPRRWRINGALYRYWNRWQDQKNPIYGTELAVRYQTHPLTIWTSFSSVSSEWEEDGVRYPTNHDFDYFLGAGLRWQPFAGFTVTANYQFREGNYYLPLTGRRWEEEINNYVPEYSPVSAGARLPAYQRLDVGLSKVFLVGNSSVVAYVNANNMLRRDNVQAYTYNQDYSQSQPLLYSRFIWFVGMVWEW